MDQIEAVTAKGEGMWGTQKYQVALKTKVLTYHDSLSQFSRKVLSYSFTFGGSSGSIPDSRSFPTEEKRRLFLARSFTELRLEEIPESNQQWKRLTSPLQSVVGCKLTAVSFVMDYLQLEFPPYGFLIYNWPVLSIDGRTVRFAEEGYRDCLRSFAGKQVSRVDEYLDKGLALEFLDGSSISVPLKVGADFSSPEVAEFSGPNINGFIWQAGEEPFD
jgi:hypothetical protein